MEIDVIVLADALTGIAVVVGIDGERTLLSLPGSEDVLMSPRLELRLPRVPDEVVKGGVDRGEREGWVKPGVCWVGG